MELYITGYAGLSGSRKIYQNEETRKKLLDHYPKSFFTVFGENFPEFPEIPAPDRSNADAANEGSVTETPAASPVSVAETEKPLQDRTAKGTAEQEKIAVGGTVGGIIDRESAAEGGVFGAMWRLLRRNHIGAEFNQRKIPLLQQTVEVCEYFGLDPYRLEAEDCVLWLVNDPAELEKKAKAAGTVCERIGFSAKGPGILRTDGAAMAYLRRPEAGK